VCEVDAEADGLPDADADSFGVDDAEGPADSDGLTDAEGVADGVAVGDVGRPAEAVPLGVTVTLEEDAGVVAPAFFVFR